MLRPLITMASALALYDNSQSDLARALKRSRQAISLWGRYLPELAARQLLELHPKATVTYAKRKPRKNARRQTPGKRQRNG